MTVEERTRRLLSSITDMPDWAYMKAIELSRAIDDNDLSGESLAVSMILMHISLDRRIKLLEGDSFTQQYWNNWFESSIDYFGELLPADPEVWDQDEDEEDEE